MTSLTKIAIVTRRIIRYSIYLVIFLIIARITIGIGIRIYQRLFPKPPPPPTVAFGKLPKLNFPKKENLPSLNLAVQTPQGELPQLPTQAKVYFMPKIASSLLALDLAKQKAAGLGFISEPEEISDTVYKFNHPRVPATLEMNIITQVFSISYNLSTDPTPLSKRPPAPEAAGSSVRSFLSAGNFLPNDLSGPATHQFLKTEEQRLIPALSHSEAELIKINLFRQSFDEIPSVTGNPAQANVWFIVSGEQNREKQIVAGEYHYFPIDETQSSTYPIKSSTQAFEDLKKGLGYIANLGGNNDGNIVIRRIYLAYYDPDSPAEFYQPIIVFEGDRDFAGYVPAVADSYRGES